jgi:hypothetical protein
MGVVAMPMILATQMLWVRRVRHLERKTHETLREKYLKQGEALSSNSSTAKKIKTEMHSDNALEI